MEDIPPLIPSMMCDQELNTEIEKKSVYLKENDKDIEGDAMCLSRILRERGMSINDIDSMNIDSLIRFAKSCKINRTSSKSQDLLRMELRQLYATILVGTSPCHEFVRSPGHTGGFYHIVCPHGTTVCSKFMVLTESVRDPADLWLSLKYPPVLFICDTPCTLVQHINHRDPALANEYWVDLDGCFEKPAFGKLPSQGMNVPIITPSEFQSSQEQPITISTPYVHPLSLEKQRYVCGDRFHTSVNPHKSPLCLYHDINLCKQGTTIKTSYQESINNKKNQRRNRSSCTQDVLHHIFYNYLMNFYENEEIVLNQKYNLQKASKGNVKRDHLMRFII